MNKIENRTAISSQQVLDLGPLASLRPQANPSAWFKKIMQILLILSRKIAGRTIVMRASQWM